MALSAFLRFGKGRHAARLNFGDCLSYAYAAVTGLPLVYKGETFGLTDLKNSTVWITRKTSSSH